MKEIEKYAEDNSDESLDFKAISNFSTILSKSGMYVIKDYVTCNKAYKEIFPRLMISFDK